MTRETVKAALVENILAILPDLDPTMVDESKTLAELGANSIDRADITIQTMEGLGIKFPLTELAGITTIASLIDHFLARLGSK